MFQFFISDLATWDLNVIFHPTLRWEFLPIYLESFSVMKSLPPKKIEIKG